MKRRAFAWWEFIAVLAGLIILPIVWITFFWRHPTTSRRSACQSNLRQIGLGFAQYVQDYDEKFPITTTEQGWFGAVQPYLKSTFIFRCPSEATRDGDKLTDYWFNRRLAGVELKEFSSPAQTFLMGDGEPSDDPNVSIGLLPPLWLTKKDSPARRHFDVGVYLFADGHVKSLKPNAITTQQFLVKP